MIVHTVVLLACAALVASVAVAQEPPQPQCGDANGPARTVAVVELHYADAEEVAFVLSRVLPPTVTVVAYRPTNSLIIAGDPAIVAELAEHRGQ